jgi:hypothetical protein
MCGSLFWFTWWQVSHWCCSSTFSFFAVVIRRGWWVRRHKNSIHDYIRTNHPHSYFIVTEAKPFFFVYQDCCFFKVFVRAFKFCCCIPILITCGTTFYPNMQTINKWIDWVIAHLLSVESIWRLHAIPHVFFTIMENNWKVCKHLLTGIFFMRSPIQI